MEIIRVDIEEIKEKFPRLYAELKARGVRATITLYGEKKSSAQIYEYPHCYRLFYGSRKLFKKFLERKNENFKTSESNPR